MQDIIRSEEQARLHCNRAIEWLLEFWIPQSRLFRVAYESDQTVSTSESANATSMLICRVIPELNELARTHADPTLWAKLNSCVTQAVERMKSERPVDVLPLTTFGILPLFSTCYLASFLVRAGNALVNPAYAIALRRIVLAVFREVRLPWEATASDRMHPFDLYACSTALVELRDLIRYAFENRQRPAIRAFWVNIAKTSLLTAAVAQRAKQRGTTTPHPDQVAQIYGGIESGDRWKRILPNLKRSLTPANLIRSETVIDILLNRIRERASNESLVQIASKVNSLGFELDSSALIYCVAMLSSLESNRSALMGEGLTTVFNSCEAGLFPAMPFLSDDKGRSIYVPSIEIASKALELLLRRIAVDPSVDTELAFSASSVVQRRICERYNTISIREANGSQREISGWCSDRGPSRTRVDAWVTLHALSFFLRRLELLRIITRREIFQDYSWIPASKCAPRWEEIEDPNLGFPGHLVKEQVQNALSETRIARSRSPTFILYGPPGASKTSLVQAAANLKGWDLLTLSPSDFLADTLDRIEHRSRKIFNDLLRLDKCIILLDEMDALLRNREVLKEKAPGSMMEVVVPAFLPKLQVLCDYVATRQMGVFFVTNYYETIDRALLRGGRINHHILMLPYSRRAKAALLRSLLLVHWGDGQRLSTKGAHRIEEVIVDANQLQSYREVERIGEAICDFWPNPAHRRPIQVEKAMRLTSVVPEVYLATKRNGGFAEFRAIIDRKLNRKPVSKEPLTVLEIQDYLNVYVASEKDARWKAVAESWRPEVSKKEH